MTGSVIGSEVLFLLLFFVHASRCAVACLCKNLSKVNFLCLPYRPCGRGNRQRKGANGKSGNAEIGRRDLCDPLRTPGSNKWEQDCTRGNQSNATDPESLSGGAGEDPEKNWFMCEADMDMAELQRIMSSSDEWRCVLRALWLSLICVVMLTAVVTTVLGLIYWRRRSYKNPAVLPLGYAVTGQQLNDGEDTEISIPKGLSPIQEVDTQDDIETLLDGNVDHCYAANLHHRIHHSTSSLTEEQIC
ncbi:uncharacterized protein LOC130190411 isoform X3 [Pseudoliparis swirei]|uniref:uncharacterized protein LOC130190411 isoform X3 n=1 Tax=Pseudoliparis swirei TaxID=2059687 RepID=UPI0024BDF2FF|nr:uncharacterized protein LOC130190411 isoform X3 [Pseudoliparis swirei]